MRIFPTLGPQATDAPIISSKSPPSLYTAPTTLYYSPRMHLNRTMEGFHIEVPQSEPAYFAVYHLVQCYEDGCPSNRKRSS